MGYQLTFVWNWNGNWDRIGLEIGMEIGVEVVEFFGGIRMKSWIPMEMHPNCFNWRPMGFKLGIFGAQNSQKILNSHKLAWNFLDLSVGLNEYEIWNTDGNAFKIYLIDDQWA